MTVLGPCEVIGQEYPGGAMERCDRPGRLVTSPATGKTYTICEKHLAVFVQDVWPVSLNDEGRS